MKEEEIKILTGSSVKFVSILLVFVATVAKDGYC